MFKSQFIERFGLPGTDPYGWGLKTLGECCELNPRRPKNMNADVEYSFVAMPSVSEDGRVDTSIERPYAEVCKGFTYFAENDVLFAKITPCMEQVFCSPGLQEPAHNQHRRTSADRLSLHRTFDY